MLLLLLFGWSCLAGRDQVSQDHVLPLRRFAVVPLTEETGILEWVFHTHGLRHCCQDIYFADGIMDKRTQGMIKKMHENWKVCGQPDAAHSFVILQRTSQPFWTRLGCFGLAIVRRKPAKIL